MVRQETYSYLSGWLAESMESKFVSTRKEGNRHKTLKGLGRSLKYSEWVETVLTDLFECFLCLEKDKRVLVGEDGSTLYAYTGAYFEQIGIRADRFIAELCKRTMRLLGIGSMYIQSCPDRIARSVVGTLTSSDEYLYRSERRYIAFTNGIFDLERGELKKFDIKYRPFMVLDISYADERTLYREYDGEYGVSWERNPAKLWLRKIGEIIPNKDMRDAFQQFCGSLLMDKEAVKIEYICYLCGSGSNGKSVVASAIAGVFSDRYFSRFSLRQLFKDSDARVNIAALEGKICNLIGDLEGKDVQGGGDFKRAVSGEKFQGRRNYKDPITVQFPSLLCCTNEFPESQDDSWGYHRRQLPIYTTRRQWTEEDKDPMLTQKLTTNDARRYIFTWIYEGYRKIQRNNGNIKLGGDVLRAQRELQDESNSTRRWWRDSGYAVVTNPVEKDVRWRPLRELYADYVAYTEDCGYPSAMKRWELSSMIRSKGYSLEIGNERRMSGGVEFCIGRIDLSKIEKGKQLNSNKGNDED